MSSLPARPPKVFFALVAFTAASGLALAPLAAGAVSPASAAGDVRLVLTTVGTPGQPVVDGASPVSLTTLDATSRTIESNAVALPTAAGADPFTLSGTSNSQGTLGLSGDGKLLTLGGYGVVPDALGTDPGSASAATVPRVAAVVSATGAVDTSTIFSGAFDAGNIRSVTTDDGSALYATGKGAKNTAGIVRATTGSTGSPQPIATSVTNFRVGAVADGRLYATSDKTTPGGLSVIGTGLPTTSSVAITSLAAVAPTGSTPAGITLLDTDQNGQPDTAYVLVEDVGIGKFGLTGSTWTAEGTYPDVNAQAVTAQQNGTGVDLYIVDGRGSSANTVVRVTDSAAPTAAFAASAPTLLATSAAGTVFRGIALAPMGWNPPASTGGTGGGTPPAASGPTVVPADSGLPLAIGDPTNETLGLTVTSKNGADGLTVAVTASSDPAVAATTDASITGTGAARTLTVIPRSVGRTTMTLTVTDPTDGSAGTATVIVGVSGNASNLDTPRFHSGIADSSSIINVGGGYMIDADDEDTVIRLYRTETSGAPVKSWDFSSHFAAGGELDLEASVRVGDTIYFSGSMSNTKKAVYQSSRNVFFSATISGSAATTELTFNNSYAGLRGELIAWDRAHSNRLGLATDCSETAPTLPDIKAGCNMEGLDLAPGSTTTAYLGFRAPLIAGKALVVPVTNYTSLIGSAPGSATFADPILLDLGGRTIREIRSDGAGQYLITAGVPDDADKGLGWAMYRWNGQPSAVAVKVASMTSESGAPEQAAGSYESFVSIPTFVGPGARVQVMNDNGTTAYYGDGVAGKDLLPQALKKSNSEFVTLADSIPDLPATVSPSSVAAGGTAMITAGGFSPNEIVTQTSAMVASNFVTRFAREPLAPLPVTADATGVARVQVVVAPTTDVGTLSLRLTGQTSGVTAAAVVQVAAPVTAGGSAGDPAASGGAGSTTGSDGEGTALGAPAAAAHSLAFTGSDVSGALGVALVLLILGSALVVVRRRRV